MKVLLLSHTGEMSGAERALLDLLEMRPEGSFEPVVACPGTGSLAAAVRALGVPVVGMPEIRLSFRLHPWRTAQGLALMTQSALDVLKLARREGADLIHANSTRAGLIAAAAASLGGPPALVHVHDCLPHGPAGRLTRRAIGGSAEVVVVNSTYTAANFGQAAGRARVRVVHYSVDTDRFRPGRISPRHARERLELRSTGPVLGLVAQLTPWKGQDDAIRMLAALRRRRPGARLLLLGGAKFATGFTRYDNQAYERRLRADAARLGLGSSVHFLGHRADLPEILPALDLLVLPSWEEPFGIALLEAMATGLPVVATSVGGPTDILTNGEDGFLLPPRRPELWAEEIDALLEAPDLLARVGERARARAVSGFGRELYLERMLASYSEAVGRSLVAA